MKNKVSFVIFFFSPGEIINRKFLLGISRPKPYVVCKGVSREKKAEMIKKLTPIMPKNRKVFWENLYVSTEMNENDDDVD